MPDLQNLYAFSLAPADDIVVVVDDDQSRGIDDKYLLDQIQEIQEVRPQIVFLKARTDDDQMVVFCLQSVIKQFQVAFQLSALQSDKCDLILLDRAHLHKKVADGKHDIHDPLFDPHLPHSLKTMSITRFDACPSSCSLKYAWNSSSLASSYIPAAISFSIASSSS